MSELGKLLRDTRQKKHLTLKEVSSATKISLSVLDLLEDGQFLKMPSYAHTVGFLKIYSTFLGLDFDKIKELYDFEIHPEVIEQINIDKENIDVERKGHSKKTVYYVLMGFIIAILVALSLNLKDKFYSKNDEDKVVLTVEDNESGHLTFTNDSSSDNDSFISIDNSSESGNIDNVEEQPIISPIDLVKQLKEQASEKILMPKNVSLEFNDTCWVHINIDGEKQVDFIAEAGNVKDIEFYNYFILDIGNATAVKIKYKDQTFSGLGGWRQPIKSLNFKLDNNGVLVFSKLN
jgi:cytoskeletal protein RodZ